MSTEAQINANRQNAQKSTGPVTEQGKAAVSQNALKHGLFAVRDVIPTESQQEFDLMQQQMLAQLAPEGAVEAMLAQRAISLAWRLQRAATMQSQILEDMMHSHEASVWVRTGGRSKDPRDKPEYLALGRVAKEDWCGRRLIERLFEYERRIEKSLFKTMAELRAMQAARLTARANQVQNPAQIQEQVNCEKQSQSSEDESPRAGLLDICDVDREKVMAFAIRTWGEPLPQWVQAGLRRLGVSVDQDQGLTDELQPIASPAIEGIDRTEAPLLSTASL